VALLVVAALGLSAAGASTFLLQYQRVVNSLDVTLMAHVSEAHAVVLGASNSRSSLTPSTKPQPYRSARAAVEAVISRVLPNADESTLGIVDRQPTYVPGVATDFSLASIPGFVTRVVSATSSGHTFLGTVTDSKSSYRYVAAPIRVAGSSDSAIFVAAIDVNGKLSDLSGAFTTYWETVLATLIIIASLGWFISGRLLSPLADLRRTAALITFDRRSERIPIRGNDDLAALGETVNGMLDRLDGAMTTQRQLLDDVRHELNTPISIISGHLELLDARDVEEVEATRILVLDELDRVGSLVKGLSLLAESEQLRPHRTVVDVGEFTRAFFAKVRILPGHVWVLGTVGPGSVALDPDKVTQAWLQLIDNAAKYSPADSEIALGSSGDSELVEFWVINLGPKIPEESRARIFERFGRINNSRGIRGSGLGLAIVTAIAAAHRGAVTLISSDAQTRFGIRIPRLLEATSATDEGDAQ
jgi:signal transduction histidine kinase